MKAVTPEEKELIYQLYDFGKSAEEIGVFINRSAKCVEEHIRLRSEPAFFDHTPSGRRVYTDEFKTELRKLSAQGESNKELANRFHMHPGSVHGIVQVQAKPVALPEPTILPEPATDKQEYVYFVGITADDLRIFKEFTTCLMKVLNNDSSTK